METVGSIDWNRIKALFTGHYQVGTGKEGADAFAAYKTQTEGYTKLLFSVCPL